MFGVRLGTSSGLGKETAKSLLKNGNYYVICACRDTEKMKKIANEENFDPNSHAILELDLGSFASVRKFVTKLNAFKGRPLDSLVCNAAVYQPALPTVRPNLSSSVLSSNWSNKCVRFDSFFTAEIHNR